MPASQAADLSARVLLRDIAEYSRPDALSRIRADAYRHPHDPANSGAYDDAADEVKERILADSTEVYELVTDINARTELGDEILIALARGEDAKELIDQFRDEVDRELEDKAQAEVRRHI